MHASPTPKTRTEQTVIKATANELKQTDDLPMQES